MLRLTSIGLVSLHLLAGCTSPDPAYTDVTPRDASYPAARVDTPATSPPATRDDATGARVVVNVDPDQDVPRWSPPAKQPADRVIAEWRLIYGIHPREGRTGEIRENERRPIVRIYGDGRVQMSSDLMLGGGPMNEGKLSDAEMNRFLDALGRVAHGLPGKDIRFSTDPGTRAFHQIEIRLDETRATLTTSMRYGELEQSRRPVIFSPKRDEFWILWDDVTRYEAMLTRPQPHMGNRAAWLELEAEILRAAALSLLPGDRPEPAIQPPPPE